MNLKTEELDRIFSGAGAFIQTGQNMCHILSDGFKDVQNAFDSRRNMGPQYQCNMPSYTPCIQYGYGYADNASPTYFNGPMNFQPYQTAPNMNNMGYTGFTNSSYGNSGGML